MIAIYDRDAIFEMTVKQWRNLRKAQEILKKAIYGGNPKAVGEANGGNLFLYRFLAYSQSKVTARKLIKELCGSRKPTYLIVEDGRNRNVVPLNGRWAERELEAAMNEKTEDWEWRKITLFMTSGLKNATICVHNGKLMIGGCTHVDSFSDRWLAQLEENLR